MRIMMYVLIFGFLISECGAKSNASEAAEKSRTALEKMMQEYYEKLESRLNEAFLPNENGHFTGKHETHYPNGNKKSEINYKDGKQNGLATWWDEDGQKDRERNYHAYPVNEQLALGNRMLKIASWIHVQAHDKAAKANLWIPDGLVQRI